MLGIIGEFSSVFISKAIRVWLRYRRCNSIVTVTCARTDGCISGSCWQYYGGCWHNPYTEADKVWCVPCVYYARRNVVRGIRASVHRCRCRRCRRCYLPIASLDGELTILYGNPRLGYRLLKALTGWPIVCSLESKATARSFVLTNTFNL